MKQRKQWLGAAIAVVVATGMVGYGVHAQDAPNNGGGNGAPNGGQPNMTPEQRQQYMQQRRDETLHGNLTAAGFTDKATQDSIVAYVDAYEKAKQALRDQGAKVVAGLRDKATPDDQITKLLADFRTAATTLQDQRKAALTDLDGKVGYTKNPRLEAYLTMIGVVGDEASLLNESIGGGRGGRGNFGGRGGRGPGGGNGPGGANGGQGAQGGAQG